MEFISLQLETYFYNTYMNKNHQTLSGVLYKSFYQIFTNFITESPVEIHVVINYLTTVV